MNSTHALRIRAPVDVVAEMDDAPVGRLPPRAIGGDFGMHAGQEIEPAMHVADGIDDGSVGAARIVETDADFATL